jgi:hypothetical protein
MALLSILSSIPAIALTAYPALGTEIGADFWHIGELWAQKTADEESMRKLQREVDLVLRRIVLKQEVIRDLIDGRIGFDNAAELYADVNRGDPASLTYLRSYFPGKTDEVRAAWQLVRHLQKCEDPAAEPIAEEWACILTARAE